MHPDSVRAQGGRSRDWTLLLGKLGSLGTRPVVPESPITPVGEMLTFPPSMNGRHRALGPAEGLSMRGLRLSGLGEGRAQAVRHGKHGLEPWQDPERTASS